MSGSSLFFVFAGTFLITFLSVASISGSSRGMWPVSWPQELDACRSQAKTIQVGTFPMDLREIGHEISFTNREDFEKAWPYIVTVKSKGGSIILEPGPSTRWATTVPAGVRILCPGEGVYRYQAGEDLIAGPPYPDSLRSNEGVMPEYVVGRDGKYIPFDGNNGDSYRAALKAPLLWTSPSQRVLWTSPSQLGFSPAKRPFILRARVDIVLIVDGDIVDLNRIHLPSDTPITDNRFKQRHNNGLETIDTGVSKPQP